jgi:hypothetical protein
MKNRLIVATFFTLILALVGCGEKKTSTYPPTDGDFVKNSDGRGTAQVWGMHFDVVDTVGNTAGSEFEGGLHSDTEQTDGRIKITLGDDVNIRLEKVHGSPITFKLNGKMYGALEVGDRVLIDKERNVKVNDTARQSEGAAP